MPSIHTPQAKIRPLRRLGGQLAPTTAFANTNVKYAIVPVLGAASLTARIKTATAGGTIDIVFVGPDFPSDQNDVGTLAFASLVGTLYTSGNPTQVAVVAGTEVLITATCHGECFAIIKFTGTGTGTITFVDVGMVPADS